MVEKFEFSRIPISVPQILSNFIFSSYLLAYFEIVMCLAYTIKQFKFWHPRFGDLPLWYPQKFVNFYLFFIFTYSEYFIKPA